MRITYDSYADALYIYTNGKKPIVKKTESIRPDLMVDFDKQGRLVGIEILDASSKMSRRELKTVHVELTQKKPQSLLLQ